MPARQNDTPTSLRLARKAHGLTQAALAATLGITREHLSRIELGGRIPSAELQARIAEHFGVPADHYAYPQADPKVTEAITRLVRDFPPLTQEQRDHLAALLQPSRHSEVA